MEIIIQIKEYQSLGKIEEFFNALSSELEPGNSHTIDISNFGITKYNLIVAIRKEILKVEKHE